MLCLFLILSQLFFALSRQFIEEYEFLGCWKGEVRKSIISKSVEKELAFGPKFKNISYDRDAVNSCATEALNRGIEVFVITNDGCRGNVHTGLKFLKQGRTDSCGDATTDEVSGRVFGRGGIYNRIHPSEGDAVFTFKPKKISKKERIFKMPKKVQYPEIIRKDIILMNKVFDKVYGNTYKKFSESNFMKVYPDIDHFNSYYGDEADTFEISQDDESSEKRPKNLFHNPGFEEPLLKNKWNCLGELNHGSGGIMSRTAKYKRSGKYAGVCHSRIGYWAGPGQFIGHVVKPGHAYKVSGWTQLLNCNTSDLHHIELWIRYQGNEVKNSTETRIILAKRDIFNNNEGWQEWNGQFFLPKHKHGFKYVQILFKGPKNHVDIVIDDMILEELPLEKDWLQEVKSRTEQIRKRDTTVRLNFDSDIISSDQLSSLRLKVSQRKHYFGFGSAVNHSPLKKHREYREFFIKNFDWGVPESAMKWNIMEEKKGTHIHRLMDDFVDTLKKFNISMRGHCIFWEVDTESPKWLDKLDKKDLFHELKARIDDTVGKYKKRISHWDVNNEMLHGTYFADKLKPQIRDWMFKTVHKEDPNSKLFVNDFDVVANGIYTQSYLEQIQGFQKRHIPLHGIGVQGHFLGWTHPAIIQERLDILAKAGLPIWITELDILERNETKRARALEHVMRVAFGHESVSGIVLWAFWSNAAWRGADTALIDDDFNLNAVGKRYMELRKEWTTRAMLEPSLVTEGTCDFKFRGFHGLYDIEVIFPDGQKISNEIQLYPKDKPLLVEINTHVNDSEEEVT